MTKNLLLFLVLLSYFNLFAQTAPAAPTGLSVTINATIPPANPYLIVVEDAIYSKLTELPSYIAAVTTDGWSPEVVRVNSKTTNNTINISSKASWALATNIIWPRVNSGTKHVFVIGELPCAVSGMRVCPDGHANTFTFDGWRDSQNTMGAYRATQFYGTPAPITKFAGGWTDDFTAVLSLNAQKMNGVGDGRFDNDNMPSGYKPKAAVGWLGGFGDLGVDESSLIRRAKIINDYLRRNVNYRTTHWGASGAAYEFPLNSADAHVNVGWYNKAVQIFGASNVVDNAIGRLSGSGLTNRPIAFKLIYTGSAWYGDNMKYMKTPSAVIDFLFLSYGFELPTWNPTSYLGRILLDSPNNSPLVVIPFYGHYDIIQLGMGKTVGEMFLYGSNLIVNVPVCIGMEGDPTIRIF